MKKVFSFIMGLVAMTSLQAANTEVARLTLTGQGGSEASYITLRVDPTVTTAQTGAYFENTDLTGNVNIYVLDGATKLSSYKKDDLTNLHLGIITNRRDAADQHYTITFNVPTSTVGLKLYDLAVAPTTPIDITNGDTYEFEVNTTIHPDYVAGTNYTINDRFVINYNYVNLNGDFDNPNAGYAWIWLNDFVEHGQTATKEYTLPADAWCHFKVVENGVDYADGFAFDESNNSHQFTTTGWIQQLTLHTGEAGVYTFTWNYTTNTLEITFPAAPAHSVTTNAYGFLSFASSENVEFLGGLKAYKGDFNPATYELTLTEVGTKVPANTGVILWNSNETAETFSYNVGVDASAADVDGNDFVGAVTAKPVAEISADAIYCLHGNELMKYVGDDDIPAGKAYLPVTVSGPNPAPKHIVMRFSETQAINNVEAEVKAEKFVQDGEIFIRRGNEVFNLQGQKVNF